MVEDSFIKEKLMKIYQLKNVEDPCIPDKDLEKIAILKLCEPGKYIKGVGIRDDRFFVIAEDANDKLYLEESKDE